MENPGENTISGGCLNYSKDTDDLLQFDNQFLLHQENTLPNSELEIPDTATTMVMEKSTESKQDPPGTGAESESMTANMQSHTSRNELILGKEVALQSVQGTDPNSELDAASTDKRSKKREVDRNYRERKKIKEQKQEAELQNLRQEVAILQQQLEKIKNKQGSGHNSAVEVKIVIEVNFPNDEAKARVMDIISKLPDKTTVLLEERWKRITVKGPYIDFNGLWQELQEACTPQLVSFSQSAPPETEEPRLAEVSFYHSAPGPYPYEPSFQDGPELTEYSCPSPYEASFQYGPTLAENYGAAPTTLSDLKRIGLIFIALLLLLLIVRFSP